MDVEGWGIQKSHLEESETELGLVASLRLSEEEEGGQHEGGNGYMEGQVGQVRCNGGFLKRSSEKTKAKDIRRENQIKGGPEGQVQKLDFILDGGEPLKASE